MIAAVSDVLVENFVPDTVKRFNVDYEQLFADPHTDARGMRVHLKHPLSSRFSVIVGPIKMSETPAQYERTPLLGEHTGAVLGNLPGMDEKEIARLREAGVV